MELSSDPTVLFLEISVHLTGFNKAELQATGMVDAYYNTLLANSTQKNSMFFFNAVEAIFVKNKFDQTNINADIASILMPTSAYNGLAMSIIDMWYTGNWGNEVISGQAYIQGLVWDVAQTHPPGAKQPGFGSWSFPPL